MNKIQPKRLRVDVVVSDEELEMLKRVAKAQNCTIHQLLQIQFSAVVTDLREMDEEE